MTDHFLEPSDAELLQRYRDGDDTAAGELYSRHHPAAVRLAASLWGQSRAEDLASDAFVAVMRAVRNGAGPQFAFRPYLLTSVRNAYYAASRSDNRHVWFDDIEESSVPTSVDDGIAVREESSLLAQAFSSLPERWQAVLWHTTIHDESPEQVAGTLGLKPSAVTSLAHRAREGLRQAYLAAHLAGTDSDECREIRELLPAYDRGRLGKRQTVQVDAHLDECDECREAAAMLGGISANLGWVLLPALLGVPGVLAFGTPAAKAAVAAGAGLTGAGAVGAGAAGGSSTGSGGAAGGSASGGLLTSTAGLVVAASVVAATAVGAVVVNEVRGTDTVESASAPVETSEPDRAPDPEPDPPEKKEKDEEDEDQDDAPSSPPSAPQSTVAPSEPAPSPASPRPTRTTPRPSPSPTPTDPGPSRVDLALLDVQAWQTPGGDDDLLIEVDAPGVRPTVRISTLLDNSGSPGPGVEPQTGWDPSTAGDGWSCETTDDAGLDVVCTATSAGRDHPPLELNGLIYSTWSATISIDAPDNEDPDRSNNEMLVSSAPRTSAAVSDGALGGE